MAKTLKILSVILVHGIFVDMGHADDETSLGVYTFATLRLSCFRLRFLNLWLHVAGVHSMFKMIGLLFLRSIQARQRFKKIVVACFLSFNKLAVWT